MFSPLASSLSTFSPEERATLRLACITPPQPGEHPFHFAAFSWSAILDTAKEGKLWPALWWKMHKAKSDPEAQAYLRSWPDAAKQTLTTAYRHSWIFAERRNILMSQVRQELHNHQIPYALHKGLGYLYSMYPDPAIRMMNDVDILIGEQDKERVYALLEKIGLERFVIDPPHPCAQLFQLRSKKFFIDVHHRISWPHQTRIPASHILRQASIRTPEGEFVFRSTEQFLFHIYHMCKEQLLRKHIPLRAYMELRELFLRLNDSLLSVTHRAKRWGLHRMLNLSLWLLESSYPGLLSPEQAASHSTLLPILLDLTRRTETEEAKKTLHRISCGLLLLASIDHPADQLAYLVQRIQIEINKR